MIRSQYFELVCFFREACDQSRYNPRPEKFVRPDSTAIYQLHSASAHLILFETAAGPFGLRMGAHDQTLTLDVPVPGLTVASRRTISNNLALDTWHFLDFEALNGNFLRVQIDNVERLRLVSGQIMFSVADIKLRPDASETPPQTYGELRAVWTAQGNLWRDGWRAAYYALQLLILVISGAIALWLCRKNVALSTFVLKAFVVGIPLVLSIAYLEFRLSGMNTTYYTRRLFLEQQLDTIEILDSRLIQCALWN